MTDQKEQKIRDRSESVELVKNEEVPSLEICFLCLSKQSALLPTIPEEDDLRYKINTVFYFTVVRFPPFVVCETCKETVEGFYEYAEQIRAKQVTLHRGRNVKIPAEDIDYDLDDIKAEVIDDLDVSDPETYSEIDEEDSIPFPYITEGNIEIIDSSEEELDDDTIEHVEGIDDTDFIDGTKNDNMPIDEEDDSIEMEPTSSKKIKLDKTSARKVPRKKKQPVQKTDPSIEKTVLEHNKISCDLCPTPFKDFDELQKHYRTCHNPSEAPMPESATTVSNKQPETLS